MASRPLPSGSRFEATQDLTHLPSIAEDTVLACLRERYLASAPYTALSASALVSLNPHKYLPQNGDQALHQYAAEYRAMLPEGGRERLPPHIFRLAMNAYYHMRRTGGDQSILLSGSTGSGKSELRRLAIKAITEISVSSAGKKGAKVGGQIANAEFILESFGHARTLYNDNASRFGKYTELQFTERGRLAGVKTLDYYLERSRVTEAPAGERNFHIFYYLVAGASQEERQHLQLLDAGSYRYLGHRAARTAAQTSDDVTRFEQLKQAFKAVGLSKRLVAQVCQLVAAILHLGNLDFTVDRDRNEDAAVVRNLNVLETVAEFLGVAPSELESVFSYRTKLVKKEICTVFLDPEGAAANRDELAKSLYSLLFAWLNECINQKLCKDDFASFIGLFDLPGFQNSSGPTSRPNSLDQFCINFANEKLQHWTLQRIFDRQNAEFTQEILASLVPPMPFFDNAECMRLLTNQPGGLIHIMDDQARRMPKKTDHTMVEAFGKRWGSHASYKSGGMDRTGFPTFIVNHYDGPVTYSAEGLLEKNADAVNPDFVSLLRGGLGQAAPGSSEGQGSVNPFIKGLFSSKAIATQAHPRSDETIVAAHQPVKPMRAPSTRRKQRAKLPDVEEEDDNAAGTGAVGGGNHEAPSSSINCVVGDFKLAIELLFTTFDETNPWFVFCIQPNDSQLANQVETRSLKGQIRSFGLSEMARRLKIFFAVSMTHEEACERYTEELQLRGVRENPPPNERLKALRQALGVKESDMAIGKYKIFLSHSVFQRLEDRLRLEDEDERQNHGAHEDTEMLNVTRAHDPFSPYQRDNSPATSPHMGQFNDPFGQNHSTAALPLVDNAQPLRDMSDDEYDEPKDAFLQSQYTSNYGDSASNFGSEAYAPSRNMFQNLDRKRPVNEKDVLDVEPADGEIVEEYKESLGRRRWVMLCTMLTFWIPGFLLNHVGGMKRPDIRQAWREKLTINFIIWFICGCTIFVIAILGNLICPTEHVFSSGELQSHSFQNNPDDSFVTIRGEVFSLNSFAPTHLTAVGVVPTKSVMQYGGLDASNLFPVQVSALCDGVDGSVSPWVTLDSTNTSDPHSQYHDFRAFTNDSRPDWYFESMVKLRDKYRVGFMGYTKKDLKNMANAGRAVAIYNGLVYEMSTYIAQGGGGLRAPDNMRTDASRQFMSDQVIDLFKYNAGQDITSLLDGLSGSIGNDIVRRQKTCLRNLFLIGKVDSRDSPQCQFATYILLALSIVMVSIIGFKFLAAIHFGGARAPEDHDKFVICQVPCYTEGEESLHRTISSLARLKYDDKRKLLFIVCDGNIVGAGNDRTTPRIVLDILGVDPNLDPEPLSFLSLGEGSKQHNMGKVYSGLYECAGHVVPYVVLAKVGKPSERQRPGNRGKRDSQMAIMHFLNKVHFNAPMNPMELEVYHQIKNVIGVNPTFYEYLFQVDADTTVDELSLNRLVSAMMHDQKIIGACGETEISNAKQSIITMAQVYEYFISHHLAKAFESLFGSITCLPGCFSIYRLRTPDTHKPLFVSNQIIHDYSENRVDTLHMKNLLHLGEDRYLTTLILKHFPTYKTKFVRDAHAATVAPDEWKVLLSQRRRWINSTIHNLAELVFLDRLCGFCCFSMRFVVFIDLLSTIVAPVTVAYIGYLIYLVVHDGSTIPTLSIVMLAAIYGLQALIFIMRMRWDMVAWMIFYILAIPAFSFFLPLYSFWKMDDFSWGSTRLVMNEGGKKIVIHDEGKFDSRSIPLKSWNDYENELWDNESNHSLGSWVPPSKRDFAESRTQSLYGRETVYDPYEAPRGISPAASAYDLHGQSRGPSAYGEVPRYSSYNNQQLQSSPHDHPASMYDPGPHPSSMYDTGAREGSVFGGYGQPVRTPSEYGGGSRPMSTLLPEVAHAPALTLGESQISNAQLERSIRSICASADLDTLTKKGVRKQLEAEFGVSLAPRKDTINAIIERVLTA